MSVTFDVSEVHQLATDLVAGAATAAVAANSTTVATLRKIETTGRALSPVLSGELRDSWSVEVDSDGLGGEVGPSAPHAPFVEYGTSVMAPQPSLGPAFDAHEPAWGARLEQDAAGII